MGFSPAFRLLPISKSIDNPPLRAAFWQPRLPSFDGPLTDPLVPHYPSDLTRYAILLDVDGTLLDIAPTPQAVYVPESLRQTLHMLRCRLGGALALVSGRPVADLDTLFAPLRLPAVGGHGVELRPLAEGSAVETRAASLDPAFREDLTNIAARHSGVIVEDKGHSIALHYRTAPKQGIGLIQDVEHACIAWHDRSIEMLTGKAVIEIKPAGFNKGTGVRELMSRDPFRGRVPIFVGDDKTDEDAFAVIPEFNGIAVSVGRRIPGIEQYFQSPDDVREWLEHLSSSDVNP
jgi:trehalose 6-phosphate phosphatase